MKYETRFLDEDEARAFVQNMSWFADRGRVTAKRVGPDRWKVRATRGAWSMWVSS